MADEVWDDGAAPQRRSGLTLVVAVVVVAALLVGAVSALVLLRPRRDAAPAAPAAPAAAAPVPFDQRVAADVRAPCPGACWAASRAARPSTWPPIAGAPWW